MSGDLYHGGHVGDLAKVGARLPEAREFLAAYDPESGVGDNALRACSERWYGSATIDTCKRLTSVFNARFNRLPGQLDALRRLVSAGEAGWLPALNHVCMVLADPYYRWVAAEYLPPRLAESRLDVYREDLERALAGRLPNTFTGPTVNRFARNIMTALRDNGYLSGGTRKRIASPPLPAAALGFGLYLMAGTGAGAQDFDGSPLFLCLLRPRELLVPLFVEGERLRWWEFTGDRARLSANLKYRDARSWLEAYLP